MGTGRRDLLQLRAIVVSGRAALLKTPDPDDRKLIKNRIVGLLAQLEESLLDDGADADVLAELDAARREVSQ